MLRLGLLILTAAACIGAGATASLAAFATELHWPLSEINFRDSACFGAGWGIVGAVGSLIALSLGDRKHLCLIAAAAVLLTWLVTYAGVWWVVVSGLG